MRKPNLQNLYLYGNKWCGKCRELRSPTENNRCPNCGRQLRGKRRS